VIKKAEATYKFFRSLKNLVDQGLIKSIDQAKAFAKQEFGEVSDLMTLQINKIFKNKNQPVVGKKDPIFDNTVETIPFDDTGTPFNPKDPQKVYGKPKIDESPAFPSYTKPKNREMTPDEYDDFVEEVGGADQLEAYNFDGTVGDAKRILKEQESRMKYMYDQYKTGKLDPVAGDKSLARKRFLEKKLEDAEMSGDKRLITQDEVEELSTFDLGTQMDQMKDIDISQGMIDLDEMNFTKNAQAAKKAIDNKSIIPKDEYQSYKNDFDKEILGMSEEDILMKKYPGMGRELAEQIATDTNPKRKADVIAMVEQTFKMSEKGMSGDDIIQTFKNTTRTKQATGGRIGYNAGSRVLQGILKLLKPKAKKSYLEKFPRVDIKELMKGEKPIKLYSGVGDRDVNTLKAYRERAKDFGVTPEIVAKDNYKGQWFTPFKEYASSFGNARNIKSKMLTTELTPKEIKLAKRYVDKINKTNYLAHPHLPTKKSRYPVTTSDNTVLIPKIKLKKLKKEGKIDTDYMIKEKIKSKLGLAEGGLAAMLGE